MLNGEFLIINEKEGKRGEGGRWIVVPGFSVPDGSISVFMRHHPALCKAPIVTQAGREPFLPFRVFGGKKHSIQLGIIITGMYDD